MTKDHILDEIRRTAATNHGKPLGFPRFAKATGVLKSDWYPHYWMRWGDAQREAGCTPNEFTVGRDEKELLGQLARFVNELGRIPVEAEIIRESRSIPGFPSTVTIRNRLGTKSQWVERLRGFCGSETGFDEVRRICTDYLQTVDSGGEKAADSEMEAGIDRLIFGYVYLFRSTRTRCHKFGKSNAVGRREYELRIQLPENVELIHSVRTDDPFGIEAYWQRRFREKRIVNNGIKSEWFNLDANDVRAFKRRKDFM